MHTILISGGEVLTAKGIERTDLLLEDGVLAQMGKISVNPSEKIDATGLLIFPGLIDCHVHFRDPGFPEKGTMITESESARAGGVTTVCEMPNTNPPTVTVAALADKVRRASEVEGCDLRFFFGVTEAIHLVTLRELFTGDSAELQRLRAACCGVKLYLDHSTGDQKVDGGIVDDVFKTCAELNITLVAHCEDADMNAAALKNNTSEDISVHSQIRSAESEEKAVIFALEKAKKYGTHLHVAHLSTRQGLERIREAKKEGVTVTCEVAPHHLFLSTDDYGTLGTLAKMNPPLRSKDHCEALLAGLMDRTVDCVATDHAPHTLKEKQITPPLKAPSGVPGVETMLPLLLNAGITPKIILDACFTQPNRIFKLGKSEITAGADMHLVLIDPKAEWTIKASELHAKCGWTPFEGWNVQGKIVRVL